MHPGMVPAAVAFVVAGGLAGYVSVQREKGALHWHLLALLAAMLAWTAGAMLRYATSLVAEVDLSTRLSFLGLCAVSPLWLLLAVRYTGTRGVETRPALMLGLALPSVSFYLAVLTNDHHHLFFLPQVEPIPDEAAGPTSWGGPLFWAFMCWTYACVLGGVALYLRSAWGMVTGEQRWRGVTLAVTALVPIAAGTVYLFGLLPLVYDPTPPFLALSLVLLVAAVFRFRLLETLPLARRDVIEHLRDGVVIADASGRVLDVNPAAEGILGVGAATLRRWPLADVLARLESEAEGRRGPLRAAPAVGDAAAGSGELLMRDGRRIETRSASVRGRDGSAAGHFLLLRDRTEERRYERLVHQTQKLETVGALAAGVAHEINNPLAFVRTNLNYLRDLSGAVKSRLHLFDEREAAELAELPAVLEEAAHGVERIAKIVEGLLRFSRLPGDETVDVDVNVVVQDAIRMAELHGAGRVALAARLAEPGPRLRGSPERLSQVLINLLLNAKQALAERAAGHIAVETASHAGVIEIRVVDDGPGIPRELQERIFDPFFTTKAPDQGTGLGLSIAFDIVREHGGVMELVSRPGAGACFTVRIPEQGSLAPLTALAAPRPGGTPLRGSPGSR